MADKKSETQLNNTGMVLVLTFFVLFTVNSVVLWLANAIFPQQVVLGTQFISKCWAIIHNMTTLALINTFAIPFIREHERRKGRILTNKEWMLEYLVINFLGVWILARFAEQLGMGITSWRVAIVLAAVLDVVQGTAMMQVEKYRKKRC